MTNALRILAVLSYVFIFTDILNARSESWRNFSMQKEPKALDWKNFFDSSERDKKLMWNKLVKRNKNFAKLHWSWRMAWVKSCTFSNEQYCRGVLRQALLKDKALVVRAEAVARIGDRFENSSDKDAIDLLGISFRNQSNSRNNKPLFIQTRILDSIYRIGGKHGLVLAGELAETNELTRDYWKKRSRSHK